MLETIDREKKDEYYANLTTVYNFKKYQYKFQNFKIFRIIFLQNRKNLVKKYNRIRFFSLL